MKPAPPGQPALRQNSTVDYNSGDATSSTPASQYRGNRYHSSQKLNTMNNVLLIRGLECQQQLSAGAKWATGRCRSSPLGSENKPSRSFVVNNHDRLRVLTPQRRLIYFYCELWEGLDSCVNLLLPPQKARPCRLEPLRAPLQWKNQQTITSKMQEQITLQNWEDRESETEIKHRAGSRLHLKTFFIGVCSQHIDTPVNKYQVISILMHQIVWQIQTAYN